MSLIIANHTELMATTPPVILAELQKPQPNMLFVLDQVKVMLPELLQDRDNWRSMYIDYQPPHLMRIHRQIGLVRANFHFFMPVTEIDTKAVDAQDINLYHPHPWMAAFEILEGRYGQYFGRASKLGIDNPPPRQQPMIIQDASIPGMNRYAMIKPLIWHQVIPFPDGKPVLTLMVTTIPKNWGQIIPPPSMPQRSLTADEFNFMFERFGGHFPTPGGPGSRIGQRLLIELGK